MNNVVLLVVVFFASLVVAKPEADCDICQTLVQAIEGWMEQNQTETQIEADLDTVCKYMTIWDSVCETMVNTGVPQIVQWIETNEDPNVVCSQIGICAAKKLNRPVFNMPKVHKPQDVNCDMCTYAVGAVEDWLESNATEQEIEQNLEQFCALFPDQQDCDNVVVAEVPQIVKWLDQNETPTQVCDQLGLCNSTRVVKPKAKPQTVKPKPQDVNCDMCTYAVGAVEDWLENNATEQEIEQNLEQFCALFPDEQDCDNVIVAEVPQIVKWLEQNESPTQVCDQLGLCNSTRKSTPADAPCFGCETVISSMESWVEDNATDSEIVSSLDALCTLVPSFQAQCDAIVSEGVTEVVTYIEKNETPEQVCQQIGFCTSNKIVSTPAKLPVNNKMHKIRI